VHLAAVLSPVGAIVLCTVLLRFLLLPLTLAAVRGERARAALAPRIATLRSKYAKDPARLGTELTELYRSTGTSPFAGFLPLLLPSPAFPVWSRIFTARRLDGHANALLAHSFLGAGLSARLFGHPLAFLPLLAVLAVLAVVAMRRARRVAARTGTPAPSGVLAWLPVASLLRTVIMPLAAVVYLVTTLTWTAVENVVLRRGLPAR